jgi:hypothetical protein
MGFRCPNCGHVFSDFARPPIHCACGLVSSEPHQRESLWAQWREAVAQWRAAGKPVRSQAEIDACLEICRQCDRVGQRLGLMYCQVCCCNLKTPMIDQLSKVKMKTETCPEGKWS